MKKPLSILVHSLLIILCCQHLAAISNPAFAQAPGEYEGDLNFTSQTDIDNYTDEDQYTAIVGDVTISGDDIVSFDKLKKIEIIYGHLRIITNNNLKSIRGFDKLKNLYGDLIIDQNTLLTDIKAFNHAISMTGALQITNNPVLSECSVAMICTIIGPAPASRVMAPTISGNATGCNTRAEIRVGCTTLPVTLIAFKASREEQSVLLEWATSSEVNSSSFEIERSFAGKDWNNIGSVDAAGEQRGHHSYAFRDPFPVKGSNLYRLKMIDADGTYAWSRIREVKMSDEALSETFIYPNPSTGRLSIQTPQPANISFAQISNLRGDPVKKMDGNAILHIDLKDLPAGIYTLKIYMADGSAMSRKFLRQ
ncbi:T9SS type A sorting domain-containing protein [Dyadobacter sp. CY323]|uniref:T9SS type A sorting domain-containing protein n=1 Tax=Dyadobacter sp. CY323 TaxID=2907302 RepID=UPI001F23F1A3|nr:T9SS type A sorting domain-containing protein [Dyadobacter sp. CY323]MCE6992784.1 T9SS type A sorting domain-containing protein [Dyadobacter sp. CY323]